MPTADMQIMKLKPVLSHGIQTGDNSEHEDIQAQVFKNKSHLR